MKNTSKLLVYTLIFCLPILVGGSVHMSRSAHINTVPGLGPINVPDANLVAGYALNFNGTHWVSTENPQIADGGGPSLGGGKGGIKLKDLATDIVEIENAILQLQANIIDMPQYLRPNIIDPLAVQTLDTQVCFWLATDAALTITNIKITLDAVTNDIAGDLMYADDLITFANPVIISVCDTSSGVFSGSPTGTATVPVTKCMYYQFDSAPHTDITQMPWVITFDYDTPN